ncbi:MAG: lamin tail domain-containing protein [Chloroflexota bacterium]
MLQRFYWLLAAFMLPVILLEAGISSAHNIGQTAVSDTVIISEIAWGGTAASSADEWIELHNRTATPINLTNWTLNAADGEPAITLSGTIPAYGFFLLERTDDSTISDIPADQIYTGNLGNSGENLSLRDDGGLLIDTANGDGGVWPAGSGSPTYNSMERSTPDAPDTDDNWVSNNGIIRNGQAADGSPLNGTPKAANSLWPRPGEADLIVSKDGPETAVSGALITYQLHLVNLGGLTATAVLLTDTLPSALTYVSDNSGLPLTQNPPNLIWQVGSLNSGEAITFTLTAQLSLSATGLFTNSIVAATPVTETNLLNNGDTAVTFIRPDNANILLDAIYYDGYESGDQDEAIRLRNLSDSTADIGGWQLADSGGSAAVLPTNIPLPAGATIWLARDEAAFLRQFGFAPGLVLANWPGFSNEGDAVILRDADGFLVDVAVYENGNTALSGWNGPAIEPYTVSGVFAADGQILYRRRHQTTGLPFPDTNQATDWAQSRDDVINGRKVLYPGWDLEQFFFAQQVTETAVLTVAIAPDNALSVIIQQLRQAENSIQIETLTFENLAIAQALIDAAQRGVNVTVLLEGSPTGGLPDQEKYICQQLAAANGQCWFMISDDDADIHDRYRYLHAKFILIDQSKVIISSENLSPNSLPADDKSDGTWGDAASFLSPMPPASCSTSTASLAPILPLLPTLIYCHGLPIILLMACHQRDSSPSRSQEAQPIPSISPRH